LVQKYKRFGRKKKAFLKKSYMIEGLELGLEKKSPKSGQI